MTLNEYRAQIADIRARGLAAARAGRIDEAEALKNEAERITTEFEAAKAAAADASAFTNTQPAAPFIAASCNVNMEDRKPMNTNTAIDMRNTAEYRSAFFAHISGRDMTDAERQTFDMVNAAFTHTTETLAGVLPTSVQNRIWDTISGTHTILADIQTLRGTGVVMEIPVHKAIKAGKAKKVGEGVANDDEQNEFATIRLAGNDYSKTVRLSYAARNMSVDALETYLVQEIGNQLAEAMSADTIASITGAIDSGNKLTSTKAAYTDITKLYGQLKRCSGKSVYCNEHTLYNVLANLTDGAGRLIYVPSANDAPDGKLLGAVVRIEDALGDGVILVGDPNRVVNNVVTDVMIETDRDIAAHTFVYSGYARAEAGLTDTQSFAMLTVSAGA